jgi:hypothetical protein
MTKYWIVRPDIERGGEERGIKRDYYTQKTRVSFTGRGA